MANRYMQARGLKVDVQVYDWPANGGRLLRDLGTWDKTSGRELDQEDVEYGEDPKAGGIRSRSDMELKRKATEASDELDIWIEAHDGYPTTMAERKTGDDGLPFGRTTHYSGSLKGSQLPEGDVTSNDRAEHTIVLRTNLGQTQS